jgi:hypothetical protein
VSCGCGLFALFANVQLALTVRIHPKSNRLTLFVLSQNGHSRTAGYFGCVYLTLDFAFETD